uniref:Uncharacterized protein n=1 Tax=Rhizophora mucronata TaxID=61149 RepID=A0A2P2JLK1_RHIMU
MFVKKLVEKASKKVTDLTSPFNFDP